MATEVLTVHAYGNVDALHGVFNAIAMIMNSGDYKNAVRMGAVVGFLVVMTLMIFPENLRKGWVWFLSVTVLVTVLLVPKADISIEDRLGVQPTVVVSNVPWALAFVAHVKSSIGFALTQAFETAFQTIPSANRALPAELSYLQHGMMFGSRLVRTSRDAVPENLYDQADLVQYIRNCVFPEIGRNATPNKLVDSKDLRTDLTSTNMGLASAYHDPGANWALTVDGCAAVWAALQTRLNAAGAAAVKKAAARDLAALYKQDPSAAITAVEQGLPAIYGRAALASASATAADVMVQNILINASADAAALQGASLNDSSLIQLAAMRTQAVSQMNAGNVVQGRIAEESLPLIRNMTEAILFAVFPVLCILLVASEGRALGALLKGYIFTLLWVELWPPMFAIVNYLQTLEAAKDIAGSAYLPSAGAPLSGLSVGTASAIYGAAVSGLGTAAWMVTFVPVIAAAVLFGMDRMMAITGAMGGGQRAAASEAANATKGNLALGGVSMHQQQLMPSWSDPTTYKRETLGGTEFGSALTGKGVISDFREVHAPATLRDTAAVTRAMSAEASAAESAAQSSSKSYDRAIDAAYGNVQSAVKKYGMNTTRALGFDIGTLSSDGTSDSDVNEFADRIAKKHGIADNSAVGKLIRAGASTHGVLALSGSLSSDEREALQRDITVARDDLHKRGTQRKHDIVERFQSDEAFKEARAGSREASRNVSASLREAEAARHQEAANLARSKDLRTKIEGAERFQRESSVNWTNLLVQYAQTRGVSVDDGIADPRQWQALVRDFIQSGTIRTDTDDGRVMWIPPDSNVGPSAVNAPTTEVRTLAAGGRAVLAGDYEHANPGGGEDHLRATAEGYGARVERRGRELGVSPDMGVDPGSMKQRVLEHQGATRAAVAATGAAATTSRGEARVDYDERADKASDAHRPVLNRNPLTGESIENKAWTAVKRPAATGTGTFADEAAGERARKAAEDEKARKELGRGANIPK